MKSTPIQPSLLEEGIADEQKVPDLKGLGRLDYKPQWLDEHAASLLFDALLSSLKWEQPEIVIYGRRVRIPRQQVWLGDDGAEMVYSGVKFAPQPWPRCLRELRLKLKQTYRNEFNSVLVNLYRDGKDSMGWHADDEPELGAQPCIVSLSLGARRRFSFKPKKSSAVNGDTPIQHLYLHHGDLLVMSGETQAYWHHGISIERRVHEPRINLTFRHVAVKSDGK